MHSLKAKGEVTVFLSMLMVVMLVFVAALIESSTISISKSYARGESERAINSIFAEYHQVLFQEFGIFAIESTYETGTYQMENLLDRLQFYGSDTAQWEVVGMQLLTDQNGAALEEQIVTYMVEKNVGNVDSLLGVDLEEWISSRDEGDSITEDLWNIEDNILDEVESEAATFDIASTELEGFLGIQGMGILSLVVQNTSSLSSAEVDLSEFPSYRTLETGISSYQLDSTNAVARKSLIAAYILEQFQSATDVISESDFEDATNLQYEIEYILGGKSSDKNNLEAVVNQILLLRMAPNYTYLLQSVTKRAEVSTMALTIATTAQVPFLQPAIEQLLLLSWAYGESIVEVRGLLSGNEVALVKSDLNWQLGLTEVLSLGTAEYRTSETVTGGISYEEYLSILLCLESNESLIMRTLDMIESRMQKSYGLEYFCVDYCVAQLELINTSTVIDGFTYEYPVSFTYR